MKANENEKESVKPSKTELLNAIADKLKDRDLFPRKNEEVRNYLKKAKFHK
jgi:hypothetical protein